MKIRLRQVIKGQATIALLALCSIAFSGQAMADDRNCLLLGMMGAQAPQCEDEMNSFDSNTTQNAAVSFSDVTAYDVFPDQGEVVTSASSVLTRSVNGLSYTVNTNNLGPDSAVSLWVFVFRNPENCAYFPCLLGSGGMDDRGAADTVLFTGAGRITDDHGQATFVGHLPVGAVSGFSGDALRIQDVQKAEVHLLILDHGPVEPLLDYEAYEGDELLQKALTSTRGGCATIDGEDNFVIPRQGPNNCYHAQFSIHLP